LPKKALDPMKTSYRLLELDFSPELTPEQASFYQSQIGILHWAIELCRVDIMTKVSMLSYYLALLRVDLLKAVFSIFAYLKENHNAQMVFDTCVCAAMHVCTCIAISSKLTVLVCMYPTQSLESSTMMPVN
jgi:hypothetical protein